MPRPKRPIDGVIVDLDDLMSGEVDIEALIEAAEEKKEKKKKNKRKKEKIVTLKEPTDSIPYTYKCTECDKLVFTLYTKIWRGKKLCEGCHNKARAEGYSAEFEKYINDIYKRSCVFCDATNIKPHLDHINMFSKIKSVGEMMEMGDPEEEIRIEVSKCQVLCRSCHAYVTRVEHNKGFIQKKKQLNRDIDAGKDVTQMQEEFYKQYDAVMTEEYPVIRARVRGEDVAVSYCDGS